MQVIAGIKRKASFVWGMEAESSASAVQNMKLVWEPLMMGKNFFLCFAQFLSYHAASVYEGTLCL